MAKKKKEEELTPEEETVETPVEETVEEVDPWEEKYNAEHDSYLRLDHRRCSPAGAARR